MSKQGRKPSGIQDWRSKQLIQDIEENGLDPTSTTVEDLRDLRPEVYGVKGNRQHDENRKYWSNKLQVSHLFHCHSLLQAHSTHLVCRL